MVYCLSCATRFRPGVDVPSGARENLRSLQVAAGGHGSGTCTECPQVPPLDRFKRTGYDGHFETDMTVSVKSYIGEPGGTQGVKLKEMVRITETGIERVAHFPFEEELRGA